MRKFLFLLSFLASLVGVGQTTIEMDKAYGLTVSDSTRTVADKYAMGQDTIVLKYGWERFRDEGGTYANWRRMYVASAYGLDAVWSLDLRYPAFGGTFGQSFANIAWPDGKWMINYPLPISLGTFTGKGSHKWYYGGNRSSTEFVIDNAKWIGKPTEHVALETIMWGFTDGLGYTEGTRVSGFRITGRRYNEPFPHYVTAYKSYGVRVWKAGECSFYDDIYIDQCTYGFTAHGGVPLGIGTLTVFNCSEAGFYGWGTSQATINIFELSCDDSRNAVLLEGGGGLPPGAILNINLLKSETGITSASRGPHNFQTAINASGQFAINVGTISYACKDVRPDAAIVINATIGAPWNYGPQGSSLNVGAMIGFGYATVLQDITNGARYASPGDHQAFSLNWANRNGGTLTSNAPLVRSSCACKSRLGGLSQVGGVVQSSFDYVACTPVLTYGTQPPPGPVTPCTGWTTGAWGTCTNGIQTRTVTATPAGCTGTPAGKPAESQTCTVAPVVPKYKEIRSTSTTATTRKVAPATLGTVASVKLVKFKVPSTLTVAWINSSLFIGQNGVTKVWGLWTYVNGVMLEVGIPVTPDQVLDTDNIPIGSALTHTIGSPNGSTAIFTGTIEHY